MGWIVWPIAFIRPVGLMRQLADVALESGAVGILFPSMANPEGMNLVVYTDAMVESDRLVAYDPAGDLPKNQRSWE